MADGLNNLTGTPSFSKTLNGREYHFRTIVLSEHGEKESYILSLKPNPLDVLTKIPETAGRAARQSIEDAAIRAATVPQFVTREQEQQFDESLHGLAWGLWRSMRDGNDEFGKLADGEKPKYISPSGVGYSITPAEGVQKVLDLIERLGNEHFATLVRIRDGAEQKELVGNSSGSETSPAG